MQSGFNPLEPPLLVENNSACTYQTVSISTTAPGNYFVWNTGGEPPSAVSNSVSAFYPSTGAKTITLLVDGLPYTYTDFVILTEMTPLPQIQASTLTACAGSPILFSTPVQADGYEWSFTGGIPASSTAQAPGAVTFASPGSYWVKLRVRKDCCGFSPWDSLQVTIIGTPEVSLPPDTFRCQNDPPILLSVDSLPSATIRWYFNGTQVATDISTYPAQAAGEYVVEVAYPGGCSARDTFMLQVRGSLPVSLGPDRELCAGDPPPLLDAGTVGDQYLWTLNGVPIATTQTILATQGGTYAVLVSNAYGCVGRDTIQVAFSRFSVDLGADQAVCGMPVVLDAGPDAVSCQWRVNGSPLSTTSCQITVTSSGTYSVSAQNASGCSATDEVVITVGTPITAQFAAPATVQVGQPVTFIDQSSPPPTDRLWNFGDGSPVVSGVANPTHTYTRAGRFPVVLAVGNGLCTDTAVREIQVEWNCAALPLEARFTATPNPVDLNISGGTVYFTNTSIGATAYLWFFGTGDTSTAISPSYAYTMPGTYTVLLIATNFNCRDTASTIITVLRPEPDTTAYLPPLTQTPPVSVYPNPFDDSFYIVLPEGKWEAVLYEATGHRLIEWHFPQGGRYWLNLSSLPVGAYFLRVESPNIGSFRLQLLKL
ncbi:MAG: PKD domain-containing protein [Bacteroidia bacterium]|nr:PKD domain-containing protein [Bacteroidia bacterium]